MITDKQVTAAAGTIADSIGPLLMGNDLGKYTDLARLILEAAEAAAWSDDMEAVPRDARIMITTANNTHVAQWAKNPFTDTVGFIISQVGDDQHIIEYDKTEYWRHLPQPPEK